MDFNQQDRGHFFLDQTEPSTEVQSRFFAKVFSWMFVALAITGLMTYTVSTNASWM